MKDKFEVLREADYDHVANPAGVYITLDKRDFVGLSVKEAKQKLYEVVTKDFKEINWRIVNEAEFEKWVERNELSKVRR